MKNKTTLMSKIVNKLQDLEDRTYMDAYGWGIVKHTAICSAVALTVGAAIAIPGEMFIQRDREAYAQKADNKAHTSRNDRDIRLKVYSPAPIDTRYLQTMGAVDCNYK